VQIDRDACRAVQDLPQVVASDPAHALEHSLEVQLPFLQKVLGEFALVPFAVGMATVEEVAQVIERLWGGRETLIAISTDLSHYHAYEEARRIDGSTVERIAAFSTDIDHEEACGATPLNGLLSVAKKRNLSIKLLAACNSGDTAGGKGQVVGYSSFALYEGGEVKQGDAGSTLISIASGSISNGLGLSPKPEVDGAWLDQAGATFVTLLRAGALRGCIGSLEAARPIGADVADNALGAAFRDPRFPALTRDEWPLCSVEVSLLSVPKPIQFADEDQLLALIRAGEDGLILEADGRRATFLPQVWESIAEPRQFLDELMRKAGVPAGTRLGRCRLSRYRVIKWKAETPQA
jgi:MEMO1 family protein